MGCINSQTPTERHPQHPHIYKVYLSNTVSSNHEIRPSSQCQ